MSCRDFLERSRRAFGGHAAVLAMKTIVDAFGDRNLMVRGAGNERRLKQQDDAHKRSRSASPWMPNTKQKVPNGC